MTSTNTRGAGLPRPLLSERHRRVLALLVREYIERGEPVSSLWLAEHSHLGVSSATVRNVLGALEEFGLVRQPHTSAGRVPTDLGYRCYVDALLEGRRPAKPAREVQERLRQAASLDDALMALSQEVSRSSHHLGFAVSFATGATALKHIDFVSLDATRVLVVIVSTSGQVSHKAVTLNEPLTPSDLTQAANYLNQEFAGMQLAAIKDVLAARMQDDRALYDRLLARVVALTSSSLASASEDVQVFVHGTSSLVDAASHDEAGASMGGLRALLAVIEEKHRLVQLLSAYIDGPGLTVVIGGEHDSPELQGFSLVGAGVDEGGDTAVFGVIGPTRMRYQRAISTVDSLALALARMLSDSAHPGA